MLWSALRGLLFLEHGCWMKKFSRYEIMKEHDHKIDENSSFQGRTHSYSTAFFSIMFRFLLSRSGLADTKNKQCDCIVCCDPLSSSSSVF